MSDGHSAVMYIALQAVVPVKKARRGQITARRGGHKRFAFSRRLPSVGNDGLVAYAHLIAVAQVDLAGISPGSQGLYLLSKELVSQRVPQMATTVTDSLTTEFISPKQAT